MMITKAELTVVLIALAMVMVIAGFWVAGAYQ